MGGLYLKAMICRFDDQDWGRLSLVEQRYSGKEISLLRQEGWRHDNIYIIDLSHPGGGAIFLPGGQAQVDVARAPTTF